MIVLSSLQHHANQHRPKSQRQNDVEETKKAMKPNDYKLKQHEQQKQPQESSIGPDSVIILDVNGIVESVSVSEWNLVQNGGLQSVRSSSTNGSKKNNANKDTTTSHSRVADDKPAIDGARNSKKKLKNKAQRKNSIGESSQTGVDNPNKNQHNGTKKSNDNNSNISLGLKPPSQKEQMAKKQDVQGARGSKREASSIGQRNQAEVDTPSNKNQTHGAKKSNDSHSKHDLSKIPHPQRDQHLSSRQDPQEGSRQDSSHDRTCVRKSSRSRSPIARRRRRCSNNGSQSPVARRKGRSRSRVGRRRSVSAGRNRRSLSPRKRALKNTDRQKVGPEFHDPKHSPNSERKKESVAPTHSPRTSVLSPRTQKRSNDRDRRRNSISSQGAESQGAESQGYESHGTETSHSTTKSCPHFHSSSPRMEIGRISMRGRGKVDKLPPRLPFSTSPREVKPKQEKKSVESLPPTPLMNSETQSSNGNIPASTHVQGEESLKRNSHQRVHPVSSTRKSQRIKSQSKNGGSDRKKAEQKKSGVLSNMVDETDVATIVAGNCSNKKEKTKIFSEGKVEIGKDGKKRLVFEINEVPVSTDIHADVPVSAPTSSSNTRKAPALARRATLNSGPSPKKNAASIQKVTRQSKAEGKNNLPPPPQPPLFRFPLKSNSKK